jgi:hypothetical protein
VPQHPGPRHEVVLDAALPRVREVVAAVARVTVAVVVAAGVVVDVVAAVRVRERVVAVDAHGDDGEDEGRRREGPHARPLGLREALEGALEPELEEEGDDAAAQRDGEHGPGHLHRRWMSPVKLPFTVRPPSSMEVGEA